MAISLDQLVYGVKQVETGHIRSEAKKYTVVNSIGAHGAYQVMRANIGPWTREAFGKAMTPAQFLASPRRQDELARFRLGRDMKKHGPEGAAAIWFSGQPNPNSTRSDGHFTVRQYVDKMLEWAGKYKGPGSGTPSTSPTGFDPLDAATGSLVNIVGGISTALNEMAKSVTAMGSVATFLIKLALPTTWVRIITGILGAAFILLGLLVLGREAREKA